MGIRYDANDALALLGEFLRDLEVTNVQVASRPGVVWGFLGAPVCGDRRPSLPAEGLIPAC